MTHKKILRQLNEIKKNNWESWETLDKEKLQWLISTLRASLAREQKLRKALEFYAEPETYFAIGFLPDPPCGDFIEDFSDTELNMKPGRRAREALEKTSEEKK